MGHRRQKSQERNFIPVTPCVKTSDRADTVLHTQKREGNERERREEEAKGDF